MENLIQTELDMAESYILDKVFGSAQNPSINQGLNSVLKLYGINYKTKLNQGLELLETLLKPLMKNNGLVDGEKFKQVFGTFFPEINNSGFVDEDFRLIDFARKFETPLQMLGQFIQ